jgi:hypothetical protein
MTYTFFRKSCCLRDNYNKCGRDRQAEEIFHDLSTIGHHIDAICVPDNDGKIPTCRLIWGQTYEHREISQRTNSYYDPFMLTVHAQ